MWVEAAQWRFVGYPMQRSGSCCDKVLALGPVAGEHQVCRSDDDSGDLARGLIHRGLALLA